MQNLAAATATSTRASSCEMLRSDRTSRPAAAGGAAGVARSSSARSTTCKVAQPAGDDAGDRRTGVGAAGHGLRHDRARRRRGKRARPDAWRATLLSETLLRQDRQFQTLWSSMEELLLTYNERPFVGVDYKAGLDQVGARAEQMARRRRRRSWPSWLRHARSGQRAPAVGDAADRSAAARAATRSARRRSPATSAAWPRICSSRATTTSALAVTAALAEQAANADVDHQPGQPRRARCAGEHRRVPRSGRAARRDGRAGGRAVRAASAGMSDPAAVDALRDAVPRGSRDARHADARGGDHRRHSGPARSSRLAPLVERRPLVRRSGIAARAARTDRACRRPCRCCSRCCAAPTRACMQAAVARSRTSTTPRPRAPSTRCCAPPTGDHRRAVVNGARGGAAIRGSCRCSRASSPRAIRSAPITRSCSRRWARSATSAAIRRSGEVATVMRRRSWLGAEEDARASRRPSIATLRADRHSPAAGARPRGRGRDRRPPAEEARPRGHRVRRDRACMADTPQLEELVRRLAAADPRRRALLAGPSAAAPRHRRAGAALRRRRTRPPSRSSSASSATTSSSTGSGSRRSRRVAGRVRARVARSRDREDHDRARRRRRDELMTFVLELADRRAAAAARRTPRAEGRPPDRDRPDHDRAGWRMPRPASPRRASVYGTAVETAETLWQAAKAGDKPDPNCGAQDHRQPREDGRRRTARR